MKKDTLIKMETFIANVLRASPLIEGDINIVTLADTVDEEGVVQMARSITVRYTNSSSVVYRQTPLVLARNINFELIHAAQNYLTKQGHEMVLEACTGAYMALTSQVPCDTGVSILKGLHLSSETFQGISESSHYVYVQKWELIANEAYRPVALDPAVAKGFCDRLFPQEIQTNLKPGQFIWKNKIYEPVFFDSADNQYNFDQSGVIESNNDLIFVNPPTILTENRRIVFVKNWKKAKFTTAGLTTNNDDNTLIVHIRPAEGKPTTHIYVTTNNDLLTIAPIRLGQEASTGVAANHSVRLRKRQQGWVNQWGSLIYVDPTKTNGATLRAQYGSVVTLEHGVLLEVDGVKYQRVGDLPFGKGWIKLDDLVLCELEESEPIAKYRGFEKPQELC